MLSTVFFDGLTLEKFKPVYYKTEAIALISNYLFSAWGKKTGERFTLKELTVPLLTRGGLKEENSINHILSQKGGKTPGGDCTRKNVNK